MEVLRELRAVLPAAEQAELDAMMRDAMRQAAERYRSMDAAVQAVAVLHRTGTGERAGFCVECGNVAPCTTVRMLEPFLPGAVS